jgi:peptide/nickel transport system permease protein
LKGWLIGDWGRSYHDNKPIRQKITEAWQWTFLLNIISFILVIVIAIPMGAILVYEKNHIIESIFIFIYSIPTFWLATFMLIFLCSGDYLTWFPAGGIQDIFYDENWSWWRKVANRTWHLVLPVIALSLPSLAYLTRQTGINIQNEMESDYIRTALAKGLSMNMTILKHAFRNALLPLIHWLGNGIPALVGGGIFIEIIFSIPGMGTLLYEAITTRDYPTIISIFNFMVLATLIGQLLADVLYYYFDPRIRFSIQSK